jgi:hypothetical protein
MKGICFIILISLGAPALAAQGTVVVPEPALDAGRATLRDELLRFRDTLNTIDAAAARLQRDFRNASGAVLNSRARVMTEACARSARNVLPARRAVLAAQASDSRRLKSRTELLQALDRLRVSLHRCETDFAALSRAGQEENVRGYGNDRAARVQGTLRRYEQVLAEFLSAMGIKVTPLGSEPRPAAG